MELGIDAIGTSSQALGLIALLVVTLYVCSTFVTDRIIQQFYDSQPIVGKRNEWFSTLRANIRSVFTTASLVADGYTQYSKSNLPFLIPNIRKGPILIIPPSSFKSILNNPESVVSAFHPQAENVSAEWTMRDESIYPASHEVDVVRKQVTKRYGSVCSELSEEVDLAFKDIWTIGQDWSDVCVWKQLEHVAARALNRVIVGFPVCRDERFLQRLLTYVRSVVRDGPAIALLPRFLKPLLAPLITSQGRWACEDSIQTLVPIVEARLQQFRANADGKYDGFKPPNDILQWLIEESSTNTDPKQMAPRRIAHRLIMLTFNVAPPAGLTLTSVLLDLYSAPKAEEYVALLREECEKTLRNTSEGYWTKDAVNKLHLLDSTIRESMRVSDFGSYAFPRRVSASEGVSINNIRIPRGVHMEIPMHSIHMDPDNYADPESFIPFRFAHHSSNPSQTHKSLVTLDDTFMTFGYLRNGCPGRWFGAHLMKVMLAFIIMNYDVEVMKEKPKMIELMEFRIPSDRQLIRVRQKQ